MKESVTYQEIVEEGVAQGLVKGERLSLLRIGRKRLGERSVEVVRRIEKIDDESALLNLMDRLADVSSWDELLAQP